MASEGNEISFIPAANMVIEGEVISASSSPIASRPPVVVKNAEASTSRPYAKQTLRSEEGASLTQWALLLGLAAVAVVGVDGAIRSGMLDQQLPPAARLKIQQDLSRVVNGLTVIYQNSAVAQSAESEFANKKSELDMGSEELSKKVSPPARNILNSVIDSTASGIDQVQESVLQKEVMDASGSLESARQRDSDILLVNESDYPSNPSSDLTMLYYDLYRDDKGKVEIDIRDTFDSLGKLPAIQIALKESGMTLGQSGLQTFALLDSQRLVDEINGKPETNNLGRLTSEEVKEVWEGIGQAGRDELKRLFQINSLQDDMIKNGRYQTDKKLNFYLTSALYPLKARHIASLLSAEQLAVDPQTFASLTMAEYLQKNTAKEWIRAVNFRAGGNVVKKFSPDTGDMFLFFSCGLVNKQKISAFLVETRAAQEAYKVYQANKAANKPAANFRDEQGFRASVDDLIKTEFKRLDWANMERVHWDKTLQDMLKDLAVQKGS